MVLQSIEVIIAKSQHHLLYKPLIHQLNKDFALAGLEEKLHDSLNPIALEKTLCDTVYRIMTEWPSKYSNLMYLIDIPEAQLQQLNHKHPKRITSQVVYLILQREWQKVWFRKNYS